MPRSCCVPGCKANYEKGNYVPVFTFPCDENKRKLWIRKIPRENLTVTKNVGVCISHFPESDIIREIKATRADGSVLIVPRKKLELKDDAVPCIFPNLPKYLSSSTTRTSRTNPNDRREKHMQHENDMYTQWLSEDNLNSLDDILQNENKFKHDDWLIKMHNTKIYFFKINFSHTANMKKVLTLNADFGVHIMSENIDINVKEFSWILGETLKCDTFAKLENLLTAISNFDIGKINVKDKISHIQNLLEDCMNMDENADIKLGFKFIIEQINLLASKQKRYSTNLLFTSCSLFFSFPAAYRYLREMKIVSLPHPSYLKTFSLSGINTGLNEPVKKYLETKCQSLQPFERKVSLLLDEIYVKPKITYKASKIVGTAENTDDVKAATTMQTFMIKSILSHDEDVVALLPVKNMDGDYLHKSTLFVLKVLHEIGYKVICVISDNNKVNVKLYKQLCNSVTIQPCISHPYDNGASLFILFDSVHILKNYRNNMLNEKSMTFIYPSFTDHSTIKQCEFRHIREIYKKEKLEFVKQAPGINYKVCYPNNFDRQNVSYVTPLFEDKTIAAVKTLLGNSAEGTAEWLEIVRNWWMTVNVKHPEKGKRLREIYAEPIRSMDQANIKFLQAFCVWLKAWNNIMILDASKNCGKLSQETHSAALHTTETLILLSDYLLNVEKFHYVFLGAFQTDYLESRFSKYRRMSGCNYNVSVQQIIESERKLKVTNLIKLQSKKDCSLNVSEIIHDINTSSLDSVDRHLYNCEEYSDILLDSCGIDVDFNTSQVITYIAGYVGYKVCYKIKCLSCRKLILTDLDMECEFSADINVKYLETVSRGGLKYPTEASFKFGYRVYQIFCSLTSAGFEQKFLQCENQKSLIKELVFEEFESMYDGEVCECGKDITEIFDKCICIWANILLNNYSKVKTNLTVEENAMKSSKKDPCSAPPKKSRKMSVFNGN